MSSIPMTVLSLRVGSFTNRSFISFRAGSMGTDVNRADTCSVSLPFPIYGVVFSYSFRPDEVYSSR